VCVRLGEICESDKESKMDDVSVKQKTQHLKLSNGP
jgi:hypothetical protein